MTYDEWRSAAPPDYEALTYECAEYYGCRVEDVEPWMLWQLADDRAADEAERNQ